MFLTLSKLLDVPVQSMSTSVWIESITRLEGALGVMG
jgi:hypothetical protein